MYIIKLINVNDNEYLSSKFIDCTTKSIKPALELLDDAVRAHVMDMTGKEGLANFKIIDIHTIDQVIVPSVDGLTCYRLCDDPHRIFIYQRKTSIVKQSNWTWGHTETPVTVHGRVAIYELEECVLEQLQDVKSPVGIEMVNVGKSDIRIPKMLTVAPMCDVIAELKSNPVFLSRHEEYQ